jgi:hypothetical protein
MSSVFVTAGRSGMDSVGSIKAPLIWESSPVGCGQLLCCDGLKKKCCLGFHVSFAA